MRHPLRKKEGRPTQACFSALAFRYRPESQHKLKPVMEDASQFTAQTLFKMVDTDSSGKISGEESERLARAHTSP